MPQSLLTNDPFRARFQSATTVPAFQASKNVFHHFPITSMKTVINQITMFSAIECDVYSPRSRFLWSTQKLF